MFRLLYYVAMVFNLALTFAPELTKEILSFVKPFQAINECEFIFDSQSVPHATLIKYKADRNPFTSLENKVFTLTLSGLTLLPARTDEDAGVWIEISVLIPQELRLLIQSTVGKLDSNMILSEVGDVLRPHITMCRLKSDHINIVKLDPNLFRKEDLLGKLTVGTSEKSGFAFIKI